MKQLDIRRAAVYCSTYKKYNSGDLGGAWINLADYSSAKEFYTKCAEIHKEEHEPEYMFQDVEYLPVELYCEDSVYSEYWTVINEVKTWPPEKEEAYCNYLEKNGFPACCDSLEDFSDNYTENQPSSADGQIKGLHAVLIEGGLGIEADEAKYTFAHRKEMKMCGARWNKTAKQWQCTTADSMRKIQDWLSGKLIMQVKDNNPAAKEEKYTGDFQKFLNTQNEYWQEYFTQKYVAAVEFTPNHYLLFEKKEIEKSFCFGYSDFGQGPTQKEAIKAQSAVNAKYVKERNMESWQLIQADIDTGEIRTWAGRDGESNHTDHIMTEIHFRTYVDGGRDSDRYVSINKKRDPVIYGKIEKCFTYAKNSFEKRVDSYLKRYGVSKIKTWTYWMDE
jgi:hypothetical protein